MYTILKLKKHVFVLVGSTITRYVIMPRKLDYGVYEIMFNASMYHNATDYFVPETEIVIKGYFKIIPCDLIAGIIGGTGKAVGQNGMTILCYENNVCGRKFVISN